jgi:hypothetical protein
MNDDENNHDNEDDDIIIPPLPAPQDTRRPISPAENRAWKAATAAHYAAKEAKRKRDEERERIAQMPKYLTRQEMYELQLARDNEDRQKQLAREAERVARELEHENYLSSTPEMATVMCNNFDTFMQEVVRWASVGYTFNHEGPQAAHGTLWHCEMKKPAKPVRATR